MIDAVDVILDVLMPLTCLRPKMLLEVFTTNIDFRSWLLLLEAYKNTKTPPSPPENLLAIGAKFKDIDFVMEIDRFHIQEEKINKNLTKIAKALLV